MTPHNLTPGSAIGPNVCEACSRGLHEECSAQVRAANAPCDCEHCWGATDSEVDTDSVVTPTSQPWEGLQTIEEAKAFHEGFKAGVTAYAVAVGHSGLRSVNDKLRELMENQGWQTIETFERLTGRKV